MINYTQQDLWGILLAFFLFPLVFVIPGYVIGWGLNIFDFRRRLPFARIVMGIVLSNALSPILFFLAYRFGSGRTAMALVWSLAMIWIALMIAQVRHRRRIASAEIRKYHWIALAMGVAWVLFSTLLLVDIQVGDRLYFSGVSYDLTTRVSVVDAITRTGVPPTNPGYYPGHREPLTFLYYFWYILGSIVDQLGGPYVTAYQAMIASTIWCGLILVATLGVYIRMRGDDAPPRAWRKSILAAQFIAIGGLDFAILLVIIVEYKLIFGVLPFQGRIEGWNMPVMSWMNALAWVPHHIAGALACLTGMMIFIQSRTETTLRKIASSVLTGLCFASAFGLSVWTTFVFAIFWVVWALVKELRQQDHQTLWVMGASGVFAMILVAPFVTDMLRTTQLSSAGGAFQPSSAGGAFPIALYVRPFTISAFLGAWPKPVVYFLNFLLLPINYTFEFGIYLLIAAIWIPKFMKRRLDPNPYRSAEPLLVITSVLILSFTYSRIIVINDLGIRGWLPMQFILIVWATDLIVQAPGTSSSWVFSSIPAIGTSKRMRSVMTILLVTGLLTSLAEVLVDRAWPIFVDLNIVGFPNELSPDTNLGKRTYDARRAYEFIKDELPAGLVIQNNPAVVLDRPAGLYGSNQMAIADRTSYGLSEAQFSAIRDAISPLFTMGSVATWPVIDKLCASKGIDILLYTDTDPIWPNLQILRKQRLPLYESAYHAVYACGGYAGK